MFFLHYSAMTTPGQATHASHTILKVFHVTVLTVALTVIPLLPSSSVLHKHKTVRQEGESDKDGHTGP